MRCVMKKAAADFEEQVDSDVRMKIKMITESWDMIEPIQQAAAKFFHRRLKEVAPEAAHVFHKVLPPVCAVMDCGW